MLRAALFAPALASLVLAACGGETSSGHGGSGGTTATGGSTAGTGGSTVTCGAVGPSGAGGAVNDCSEIGATECLANVDCPNAADRCENRGTTNMPVACCVTGARGTCDLGAPCTHENECVSALCIDTGNGFYCSNTCDTDADCTDVLPTCFAITTPTGTTQFCAPL